MNMKTKFAALVIVFVFMQNSFYAQTTYEVQPGTKSNEIKLNISNISGIEAAENLYITLIRKSSSINFRHEEEKIDLINPKGKKSIIFKFDIKRETEVNKKDTVTFLISGRKGLNIRKEFVLKYTAPGEYALLQNYPNPFNPTTTIKYDLPFDSKVSLKIYDILGNEVRILVDQNQTAGYKEIKFNGSSLASGVYIYRMIANNSANKQANFVSIKKMLMIK